MTIIVLIKQVPETDSLVMDEAAGTVVRKEDSSIINPLDLYALEAALRLKDANPQIKIIAISMGPGHAAAALAEAVSMGCDDAILVSGKEFAGSDTWATAKALAAAVSSVGVPDLVLCGERATDGDTGQVGPEVAAFLGLPVMTYASSLSMEAGTLLIERILETDIERIRMPMPCVISVTKAVGEPRLPTLSGKKRAFGRSIPVLGTKELALNPEIVGNKGSPTRVAKISSPKIARHAVILDATDPEGKKRAIATVLAALEARGLLPETAALPDSAQASVQACEGEPDGAQSQDNSPAETQTAASDSSSPKRSVWILAEARHGNVLPISFELLQWAHSLGPKEHILTTAVLCGPASEPEILFSYGADRIIHCPDSRLAPHEIALTAGYLDRLLASESPDVFLAGATTYGRSVMPYLAALSSLGLTADCTSLAFDIASGELLQTRPAAGGNIMATIRTLGKRPQMATVRPHSQKPRLIQSATSCIFEMRGLDGTISGNGMELLEEKPLKRDETLDSKVRIVAFGRGLKKKDNLHLIQDLALVLDAGIGASREAVDRGWADYPRQVGLSGHTVSPDLYLACGISGAIQHLAGMQTSGFIVAINADPDAPIFSVSDIAVRADIFDFLPSLTEAIKNHLSVREAQR